MKEEDKKNIEKNKELLEKIKKGDIPGILESIENGADVNSYVIIVGGGSMGSNKFVTPLSVAIENGNKGIVEILINKGANVEGGMIDSTTVQKTALWLAVSKKKYDIAKFLIDNGADYNFSTVTLVYDVETDGPVKKYISIMDMLAKQRESSEINKENKKSLDELFQHIENREQENRNKNIDDLKGEIGKFSEKIVARYVDLKRATNGKIETMDGNELNDLLDLYDTAEQKMEDKTIDTIQARIRDNGTNEINIEELQEKLNDDVPIYTRGISGATRVIKGEPNVHRKHNMTGFETEISKVTRTAGNRTINNLENTNNGNVAWVTMSNYGKTKLFANVGYGIIGDEYTGKKYHSSLKDSFTGLDKRMCKAYRDSIDIDLKEWYDSENEIMNTLKSKILK